MRNLISLKNLSYNIICSKEFIIRESEIESNKKLNCDLLKYFITTFCNKKSIKNINKKEESSNVNFHIFNRLAYQDITAKTMIMFLKFYFRDQKDESIVEGLQEQLRCAITNSNTNLAIAALRLMHKKGVQKDPGLLIMACRIHSMNQKEEEYNQEDSLRIVQEMLKAGWDPNAQDEGTTPFLAACETGSSQLIELCLEKNDNSNEMLISRNAFGMSALDICCKNLDDVNAVFILEQNLTLEMCGGERSMFALMSTLEDLFINGDNEVVIQDCYNFVQICYEILKKNPDLSIKDEKGNTVLHYACTEPKNINPLVQNIAYRFFAELVRTLINYQPTITGKPSDQNDYPLDLLMQGSENYFLSIIQKNPIFNPLYLPPKKFAIIVSNLSWSLRIKLLDHATPEMCKSFFENSSVQFLHPALVHWDSNQIKLHEIANYRLAIEATNKTINNLLIILNKNGNSLFLNAFQQKYLKAQEQLNRINEDLASCTQRAKSSSQKDIPGELCCPLSRDLIEDPVRDIYGHVYEKEQIVKWINQKGTSPITRQPLTINDIEEDKDTKQAVEKYKQWITSSPRKRRPEALEDPRQLKKSKQ